MMADNFANKITTETENTRSRKTYPNEFLSKRDWQFVERAVLPNETGYARYEAECWATCVLERMRHWQINENPRQESRDVIRACISGSVFREFPGNKQWRARMEQLAKAGLMTKTTCGKPNVAAQYEVRVGPWPDSQSVRDVLAAIHKAEWHFSRPCGVWVLAVGMSDEFDDQQLRDRYGTVGAREIVGHRLIIDGLASMELATSE